MVAGLDPFWRRPVPLHPDTHPDPYWGPATATVDWCEPNYVHNRYVAEMWNTLSCIPMLVVSLRGLYLARKYKLEMRVYLCWAGIGIIGIGSALFHATLKWTGQVLDELPMIYASLIFAYTAVEASNVTLRYPWLPWAEGTYSVLFTIAYFYFPFVFPIFIVAYGVAVLATIFQSWRVYKLYTVVNGSAAHGDASSTGISDVARNWQKTLFWIAASFYPGGFLLLWLPENTLCPLYPELFQKLYFHAIFHIISTISPYCYVVFMTYHRVVAVNKKPAEHRLGNGLPYVHVFGKDAR
eukprot:TRINITY_DN112530_c0_g1_i1.p1 TRINITY_DN112530_c0_g1~~TRINITY_DN112530_c0_g1_i1.p1  ORF type:complete len:296 (+),score=14.49 TRINITY_DN112530_c0_g1_i1:56-943(+)